jgi:hypothetical protein
MSIDITLPMFTPMKSTGAPIESPRNDCHCCGHCERQQLIDAQSVVSRKQCATGYAAGNLVLTEEHLPMYRVAVAADDELVCSDEHASDCTEVTLAAGSQARANPCRSVSFAARS